MSELYSNLTKFSTNLNAGPCMYMFSDVHLAIIKLWVLRENHS